MENGRLIHLNPVKIHLTPVKFLNLGLELAGAMKAKRYGVRVPSQAEEIE